MTRRFYILFALLLISVNVEAATLISENFNDQAYTSPLTLYNGIAGGYDTSITYSSSVRHGSTGYSVHVDHAQGDIMAILSGAQNYHSSGVYYRYWVYYPSTYQWCVEAGGTQGNVKLLKMAGDPGWDLEVIYKESGAEPTQIQTFWNTSGGGVVSHYNSITNDYGGHNYLTSSIWHKVEIYMQIPNAIHVSIDDQTVYNNTNADIRTPASVWTGTQQFISIRALGGCVDPPSGHGDWYFDDITVVSGEGDLSSNEPSEPGTSDTVSPVVSAFTIPSTSSSLTIPIATFTATDNVGVTGYMVNESSTSPSASASGWSSSAPSTYTTSSQGTKTLYAWAKDAAGNVSAAASDSCVVTVSSGGECTHYVAKTGNDSYNGTSTSTPWLTIAHAASVADPDDVICIRSGTYGEDVTVSRSGTSGHPITFRNYPGESPLLASGNNNTGMAFWISGSYVKLYGLTFRRQYICGSVNTWSVGLFGDHNEVDSCSFLGKSGDAEYDAYTLCGGTSRTGREIGIALHGGDYSYVHDSTFDELSFDGITVFDNGTNAAKYWKIVNNTFSDYLGNGIDAASATYEYMFGLIEGNTFEGSMTSDGVQFNHGAYILNAAPSTWGVRIRNNVFKCSSEQCTAENSIDLKGASYIVIENNLIQGGTGNNDGLHDYGSTGVNDTSGGYGGVATGSGMPSEYIVIRGNTFVDNAGGVVAMSGYRIYNNTIINNDRSYSGPNSSIGPRTGASMAWFSDVKFVNNMIGGNAYCNVSLRTIYSSNYSDYNLFTTDAGTPYMCAFSEESSAQMALGTFQTWLSGRSIGGKEAHSLTGVPDFDNASSGSYGSSLSIDDFMIGSSSAAINKGGNLTTATNSGSSSTTLTVGDGTFFTSGMSAVGVAGDRIQIGGDVEATISGVSGNTIYLSSAASWSSGDGVIWCKNGDCPSDTIDIGAWEYGASSTSTDTGTDTSTGTDTGPATLSGGSPSGVLSEYTTSATVSANTDVPAVVHYSTSPGVAYDSMSVMDETSGTLHQLGVTGLSSGNTYTYYLKAYSGDEDYVVSFSIAASSGGGGETPESLLNDQTYSDDSGDFHALYPVTHLWDEDVSDNGISGGLAGSLWVEFDLGAQYDLTSAKIYGDNYGNWYSLNWTMEYKVESGDSYSTAFSEQDCFGLQWFTEEFTVTGRYVKFTVVGNASYPGTQIYEMQLFGDLVTPAAPGTDPISFSSTQVRFNGYKWIFN